MSEIGLTPLPPGHPSLQTLTSFFLNLVKKATQTKENVSRFPGTMPITLSKRHLGMIYQNDYVVLEKSDGTRYMLFCVPDGVLLIDRLMRFYPIEPNPEIRGQGFVSRQENTVLDGELTFNIVTQQWDYLIYDCISIAGDISVARRGFRERMAAAEAYVAGPRLWAPFCSGLLRLRIKDYYEKGEIRRLFSHIKKDPQGHYLYINNDRRDGVLFNQNDGVIFSPVGMGYQVKKCSSLLKWKPPHLNSVDFTLQLERKLDPRKNEPTVRPFLAYKGDRGNIRLREIYPPSSLKRQWAAKFDTFNEAIVEMAYHKYSGEWTYIRRRADKETPNYSSTVIDTLETIAESMDREDLVRSLEKHCKGPPQTQLELIKSTAMNRESCTFRDDYFDESNHQYMVTTPISLVRPPSMRPPPGKRYGKGPRSYRGYEKKANGSGQKSQNAVQEEPSEAGRMPVAYTDDV